jgi:RNA polymerase sporulation-specific sigma factor
MNTVADVIKENEGLIYSLINELNVPYLKEDLYQVGAIGLINAYKNFDPSKGTKFSTYAYLYILGEMKKYIREDRNIKISREISYLGSKIERARELLTQKYNRIPNTLEIAQYLNVPEEYIIEALNSRNSIRSIDEVINSDGKELTLKDTISVVEPCDKLDLIALKDGIKSLSDKERNIIIGRYFEDKTQSELAGILGISQVQVYREEQKAIDKLRDWYI